ncbi:hypothetical protein M758_5G147600 [Ceratodon purpureus]|nr:hypothetical protein M758_5G147600 [Ceratodon purpureus]
MFESVFMVKYCRFRQEKENAKCSCPLSNIAKLVQAQLNIWPWKGLIGLCYKFNISVMYESFFMELVLAMGDLVLKMRVLWVCHTSSGGSFVYLLNRLFVF